MKTGQIIQANPGILSFLYHYGIILEKQGVIYVMHNSPFKGPAMEPFDQWIKLRKNYTVYDSDLMKESCACLQAKFNALVHKSYNLLTYNCEHFLDEMLEQEQRSEQMERGLKLVVGFWLLRKLITKR